METTPLVIMTYISLAALPVLMLLTIALYTGKTAFSRFLPKEGPAGIFLDRLRELGPREGWAGYVMLITVCLWLAIMAVLVLNTVNKGGLEGDLAINESDMVRIEMDGGGYGYVSKEEMDEASFQLIQSGKVPGEIIIDAYSENGEVIGEYTIRIVAG